MDEKIKKIPQHVGIILDGNRRWSKERNLPTFEGHKKGYQIMCNMPKWFFARGVKVLTVYAFSEENWNRSRKEVDYLMKLLKEAFTNDIEKIHQMGCKLLVSGRIQELPGDLPETCLQAISKTSQNKKGILNICLNYSGRSEIVDAVKKIVNKNFSAEEVSAEMIKRYLYNSEAGDPDIIVRTSGEHRLSGFQLWQSAYSEFLFLKKYWPDFEESDVDIILDEYNNRKRRFGGDVK